MGGPHHDPAARARPTPGECADQARTTIRAMGSKPGFEAAFAATFDRRYLAGPIIDAPVTIAFGFP